jgi:outer membrane protein insertion porin family
MRKVLLTAFLILTLTITFAGSTVAQNIPIDEITKITVEGNEYVSDFEILNAVKTEVGDQTDQEALRSDMQSIFDLGYFSDVNIVFENFEGGLNVIFEVVEKRRFIH